MPRTTLDPSTWLGPKRLESETQAEFRVRRELENKAQEARSKGFFAHQSARLVPIRKDKVVTGFKKEVLQSTYRKEESIYD